MPDDTHFTSLNNLLSKSMQSLTTDLRSLKSEFLPFTKNAAIVPASDAVRVSLNERLSADEALPHRP